MASKHLHIHVHDNSPFEESKHPRGEGGKFGAGVKLVKASPDKFGRYLKHMGEVHSIHDVHLDGQHIGSIVKHEEAGAAIISSQRLHIGTTASKKWYAPIHGQPANGSKVHTHALYTRIHTQKEAVDILVSHHKKKQQEAASGQ